MLARTGFVEKTLYFTFSSINFNFENTPKLNINPVQNTVYGVCQQNKKSYAENIWGAVKLFKKMILKIPKFHITVQ